MTFSVILGRLYHQDFLILNFVFNIKINKLVTNTSFFSLSLFSASFVLMATRLSQVV